MKINEIILPAEYNEEAVNENISALQTELEQKYNLKSLFLADMGKRNAIELHSIIVNKEEQGAGTGSKVMQEIIAYADANGKIVVLDPGLLDKQHGTTSQSRLRKFYKRFGFIDNKGRNKNYEFRNLMIRYPQSNESVNEATEMKISDLTISDAGMAIAQSVDGGSRTDAPLAVTKLPSGHVYLVNGYHRLVDAMNSGKDTVSVEYVPYEKVEILWKQEREQDIKYGKQFNESLNEGYKLQLERDTDMMVLNITDTKTGKRTEVRGKAGYETNGYDANDKLHQLLDKISKTANISELMNGEPVGINPKHPDGASAKTATTKAFNETAGVGRVVKGVNTTVDVGVDEIINQVKKFGNDVDRDGKPKTKLR
jgi:GNAT superfamily N-acetyltransferase